MRALPCLVMSLAIDIFLFMLCIFFLTIYPFNHKFTIECAIVFSRLSGNAFAFTWPKMISTIYEMWTKMSSIETKVQMIVLFCVLSSFLVLLSATLLAVRIDATFCAFSI